MQPALLLPGSGDVLQEYVLTGTPIAPPPSPPAFDRVAYAAAHVVADPLRSSSVGTPALDWQATLAFRHHLWSLGFKVAEAMDTSQRGMGITWPQAQELIRRSLIEARSVPGADLACGAGTEQLPIRSDLTLNDIVGAYEEQFDVIESGGGRVIMMASRALARVARSPQDYHDVYSRLLSQAKGKVILHWLGAMFDPELSGYWGSDHFDEALHTVLAIINDNADRVEGIKISLLDASAEITLRQALPDGVLCFTGDDFNYPELIEGDGIRHSHALLGIFDPIAGAASAALTRLARGDTAGYRQIMNPTLPLARRIFEAPTMYYKAGVVFLAWLNGHQSHFIMPAGMQSARSLLHYADLFRLADAACILEQPDLAVRRMRDFLQINGIS